MASLPLTGSTCQALDFGLYASVRGAFMFPRLLQAHVNPSWFSPDPPPSAVAEERERETSSTAPPQAPHSPCPDQPCSLPHLVPLRWVMGWVGEGPYCKPLSCTDCLAATGVLLGPLRNSQIMELSKTPLVTYRHVLTRAQKPIQGGL